MVSKNETGEVASSENIHIHLKQFDVSVEVYERNKILMRSLSIQVVPKPVVRAHIYCSL